MARSGVADILDKYRWTVDIPGFTRMGFLQCGVPRSNITPREYAEGGAHLNPKQIVDRINYIPVTLLRGVTNDTSFSKWASAFIDVVQNEAALKSASASTKVSAILEKAATDFASGGASVVPSTTATDSFPFNYRRTVKIEHCNRAGQVEVVYTLYNAYPIAYQPASDFDAMGDDAVSVETLVLGYEGFDVKYTGVAGFAGNLISSLI